jgi:hypothetical protein
LDLLHKKQITELKIMYNVVNKMVQPEIKGKGVRNSGCSIPVVPDENSILISASAD